MIKSVIILWDHDINALHRNWFCALLVTRAQCLSQLSPYLSCFVGRFVISIVWALKFKLFIPRGVFLLIDELIDRSTSNSESDFETNCFFWYAFIPSVPLCITFAFVLQRDASYKGLKIFNSLLFEIYNMIFQRYHSMKQCLCPFVPLFISFAPLWWDKSILNYYKSQILNSI